MQAKRYREHTRAEIVSFSRVMAVFLALIAALLWWRSGYTSGPALITLLAVAAAFGLTGVLLPAALRPPHHLWMLLAFVLNLVMTRILLGTLFLLVITPLAGGMRLLGRPLIGTRRRRPASYWWRYTTQAPAHHFEHLHTMSTITRPDDTGPDQPLAARAGCLRHSDPDR